MNYFALALDYLFGLANQTAWFLFLIFINLLLKKNTTTLNTFDTKMPSEVNN